MRGKIVYRSISALIVLAIFFSLGKNLSENWNRVKAHAFSLNPLYLFFAFILYFAFITILSLGWWLILRKIGGELKIRKAISIFLTAQIGKYLPGKIWTAAGKISLTEGTPRIDVLVSSILEIAMTVLSGAIVGLHALFKIFSVENRKTMIAVPFLLITLLLAIEPRIFYSLLNFGLKKARIAPIPRGKQVPYLYLLALTSLYLAAWIIGGLSYFLLVKSITSTNVGYLTDIISIFALSYVVGFVMVFIPGGLGIREGVQSYSLGAILPLGVGIIISLLARLWTTIADIFLFAGGTLFLMNYHLRPNRTKIKRIKNRFT